MIMGSGKTSAAINYMNSAPPDKKFMFVTPYLAECKRIRKNCAARHFVEPYDDGDIPKSAQLHNLLKQGENIVITHALFLEAGEKVTSLIEEGNYTLILDETISSLAENKILCDEYPERDLDEAYRIGYIGKNEDEKIIWLDKEYAGRYYQDLKQACETDSLRMLDGYYIKEFDYHVFESFHEIIVLTYLFPYQLQRYFFDTHNFTYTYIGVERGVDGGYYFTDRIVNPEFARGIRDRIKIVDGYGINTIGDKRYALSASWYKRNAHKEDTVGVIGKKIYTFFRNRCQTKSEECMWTVFKSAYEEVNTNGYSESFVPCNIRASNQYADRHYLAYCVNVFMNPNLIHHFNSKGCNVDCDGYALSEMVQWIWRSAIRREDGGEITIFIPSSRMRSILQAWLDDLAAGGHGRDNYDSVIYNEFEQNFEE